AEVVLRLVKAKQHERAAKEHDVAGVLAVEDADQAERKARQEAPVRARERLEMLGRPALLELVLRQSDLGHLAAAGGAALLRAVRLGLVDDGHARTRAPVPLEQPARVARPHRSSTSTRSPAAASPSPGSIRARPSAPTMDVSTWDPWASLVGRATNP